MDLNTQIQLLVLFLVNVFFTFFGVVLNAVVILSLWKSIRNFERNYVIL